jgi:hypothetical protein
VSNFNSIIQECTRLLCTDLANSNVKFIRRREVPSLTSFHIFYGISTCIETILINEMH